MEAGSLRVRERPARDVARRRPVQSSELAWIAALPCALAIVVAIVVVGPAIGHALPKPGPDGALWPTSAYYVFGEREPAKQGRCLVALTGPLLLAGAILAGARWPVSLRPTTTRALVAASQALLIAFVAAAAMGQRNLVLHTPALARPMLPHWGIFPVGALVGALAFALLLPAAMRRLSLRQRISQLLEDTRARRIGCAVVAATLTACWLLTAVDTETTARFAAFFTLPPWAMADTLAILDGRTPLVDFYAMYGQVWAYVAAVPLYVLGATITVFSIVMVSISALALLSVYALFRRLVRSSLLALGLFLPFLATGFLGVPIQPGLNTGSSSNGQIFSVWPMRYAGPYLLAWLTVRHLDGAAPRRRWPLFLAAGLVIVNNLEFGLGATAGLVAALLAAQPPRSWRAAGALVRDAAIGLLAAVVPVVLVTVIRSGELPHVSFLLAYPRIFGSTGYTDVPMPTIGLHLAVFVTFAAAIATAVVRCLRREPDVRVTGMLAWSGVFGLGAASYYMGRSDLYKLVALFSVWSFALALLLIVVVRGLAARDWRRPGLVELLVLFGFGLTIASLRELPTPWSQVARLQQTRPTLNTDPLVEYRNPRTERFVDEHTAPGERVGILIEMGHRIARNAGIVNVAPYAFIEAMVTRGQMRDVVEAMHREDAHKLFVHAERLVEPQMRLLEQAGFVQHARSGPIVELSDVGSAQR